MNQRNTSDAIRKYYLNEMHNFFIIYITLCFNVIYLMKLIPKLEDMLNDLGLFATLSGITTISFWGYVKGMKQIKKNFLLSANERDKKEPFTVLRNTYLEKLKNVKGYFFVLGESGVGKSRLLSQLQDQLGGPTYCSLIQNNYFNFEQQIGDTEYIIFDQFEKILDISEPSKRIKFIKELNNGNRTIILSLRKEYFAEIYKMFEYHGAFLWIEYSKNENIQIITQLYNLIGEENIFNKLDSTFINDDQRVNALYSNIENNKIQIESALLKQLVRDIIENKILFIQLSYLGQILQQDNNGIQEAENDWKEFKDYNVLIMHYIEKKIDNFIYSDIAYLILFLLCQDTKGIYANMEDDFENISMQPKEIVRNTLEYLEDLQLILQIKSDDNYRNKSIVQYEISHDYILDILLTLCNNKMDIGIRNNIIFYNREYQLKRNEYTVQKESLKEKIISTPRGKYVENKNKSLYILLGIMLVFIIGVNSYNIWLNPSPDDKNIYWRLFLTNITTTVSTYYIFNYYNYFMRIFGYKYWIGVMAAMFSAMFSYFCANYWVMGYGFEIIVVGVIMWDVFRKTRISEKSFFKDRSRNYCIIGVIVMVLGYYYPEYTDINMKLAWPCYVLYAGYMLLGIMGHINKPYILALLGKVLYKDRRKELK